MGFKNLLFALSFVVVSPSFYLCDGLPSSFTTNHPSEQEMMNSKTAMIEIKQLNIYSKIRYRYCRTEVSSVIQNHHRTGSQEVNFTMRIPENAFVSNFTIISGNEIYQSYVMEKEDTFAIYTGERRRGKTTGIVFNGDDVKSRVFNVSVNIEARREVYFSLMYDEQILWESGRYQYATFFQPHQMENVKNFSVKVDLKEFYNIRGIEISNLRNKKSEVIEIYNIEKVRNGTTAFLEWEPSKNSSNYAKLISEETLGQFLVFYDLERDSKPGEILLRDGYFVHTLNTENLPILPKLVMFVLDISGSMFGERLEQLKAAMKNILNELRPEDYFNIITFSSDVHTWSTFNGKCAGVAIPFNASAYKDMAIDFIDNLEVYGSTNIHDALITALKLSKSFENPNSKLRKCYFPKSYLKANVTSMIVFLTDGEPTSGIIDHDYILSNVRRHNQRLKSQMPIFSLALGAEAHYTFVRILSLQNHGFARRIYVGLDSHRQLEKFYQAISSPVLSNVKFLYTSSVYTISDISFTSFSNVNKGKEIQIVGKLSPKYEITVLSSDESDNEDIFNVSSSNINFQAVDIPSYVCKPKPNPSESESAKISSEDFKNEFQQQCEDRDDYFMERRWAYIHIMNLISTLTNDSPEDHKRIVDLSLQYQFVTPYTALVVFKPGKRNRMLLQQEIVQIDSQNDVGGFAKGDTAFYTSNIQLSLQNNPKRKSTLTFLKAPVSSGGISSYVNVNPFRVQNSDPNALRLSDLTWMKTNLNIQIVNEKNKSDTYVIQKAFQKGESSDQYCFNRANFLPGKCKPLQDCIVSEFLHDFTLFIKSYFCPIQNEYGRFIGTCCTS